MAGMKRPDREISPAVGFTNYKERKYFSDEKGTQY